MPELGWNREIWEETYTWDDRGEGWSVGWGGSEAQWFGSLYPRLHRVLPAKSILEIAPGFGRWTRFLLPLCQNYLGIDLSAKAVSACQKIFSDQAHATFLQNDGQSLEAAPAESFDLVFSFDSLVHAELDVLALYIPQILQKLLPSGVAFIHHSNILPGSDEPFGPCYRATTVSADKVYELITTRGGKVLIQETVNWYGTTLHDCFTLFGNAAAYADITSVRLENSRFMDEAFLIKSFQSFYSHNLWSDTRGVTGFSRMRNLALNKPATQSSISVWSRSSPGEDAKGANNGQIYCPYGFHTDCESNPWWQVDLQDQFLIHKVVLYNRQECEDRLKYFSILKSLDGLNWQIIFRKQDSLVFFNHLPYVAEISGDHVARYVRIRLDGVDFLHFSECQVFGEPAGAGVASA